MFNLILLPCHSNNNDDDNGMKALTLKKVRFQILFHGDGGKYEKLKIHPSKTGHYIFNL